MEIKRKKLTNEQIYETEQKLISDVSKVCEEKKSLFEALGYDIELVFGQKENEAERTYSVYEADEAKTFLAGYISHAVISIKRKKNAEELAREEEARQYNLAQLETAETEEEVDALQNEEELRVAEDANRRLIAFTEMMLVRAYKSFWTEWICLGEDTRQIEEDLDEFYEKLKAKTEAEG